MLIFRGNEKLPKSSAKEYHICNSCLQNNYMSKNSRNNYACVELGVLIIRGYKTTHKL